MLRKYETVTVFRDFNIKRHYESKHQGKCVYSIVKVHIYHYFFFIF